MKSRILPVAACLLVTEKHALTAAWAHPQEPPTAAPPVPTAAASSPSSPVDLSTPQKAVESFLRAVTAKDFAAAARCVAGASPDKLMEELSKEDGSPKPVFRPTNVKVKPMGENAASVTVTVVVSIGGTSGLPLSPETVNLRRQPEDGTWRIVPLPRSAFRPGQHPMITEMSTALANPDVVLKAREAAREAQQRFEEERAESGEPANLREVSEAVTGGMTAGKIGRLVQDTKRSPAYVAKDKESLLTHLRLSNLKEIKDEWDGPFTKAADRFTEAEYQAALGKARKEMQQRIASGDLWTLPHGTKVKVVEHHIPDDATAAARFTANELENALQGEDMLGVWQVEVMDGAHKGKTVWTTAVNPLHPTLGDIVKVRLAKKPGDPVPAAVDFTTAAALVPEGKPTEAKQKARFERLLREKRFVLLAPNTRSEIKDAATDGSVYIIRPLAGPMKGKTLFVRTEHAALE